MRVDPVRLPHPELVNINELTVCQTLFLLIRKIKDAVIQCFSSCYIAIQNHTPILSEYLTQQRLLNQSIEFNLRRLQLSEIRSAIKEANLQENIALKARFHLSPFNRPCQYPRRIGCGTPFVNSDLEQLKAQSRQALFDELPIASKNSLNALRVADKVSILNSILDSELYEFDNTVHVLENDLFQCLNQPDLLDSLRFDNREADESTMFILRQRLTEPLSESLNRFSRPMQDNLLNSAYCQLKKIKTGNGDIIEC